VRAAGAWWQCRCYRLFGYNSGLQTRVIGLQTDVCLQINATSLQTQPGFEKKIDFPVSDHLVTPRVCIHLRI
jgi:hypothetical protein